MPHLCELDRGFYLSNGVEKLGEIDERNKFARSMAPTYLVSRCNEGNSKDAVFENVFETDPILGRRNSR